MTGSVRGERAARLGRLAVDARDGDRSALEALLTELRDDVYRLALRMTGHPEDAEDATQEVLVKILTRLGSWRGEALITTWTHRVTVNHLLERRRSRIEAIAIDFEAFGADLLDGLDRAASDTDPEQAALAEEVRLGCTTAMLQCLDREHRIAYILGEIFELPGETAAWITDVPHDTHRKRLSRARSRVRTFLGTHCGLVTKSAPCRCVRRIAPATTQGRVSPDAPGLAGHPVSSRGELRRATRAVEHLQDSAAVMRRHPDYAAPERLGAGLLALIEGAGLGSPSPRLAGPGPPS